MNEKETVVLNALHETVSSAVRTFKELGRVIGRVAKSIKVDMEHMEEFRKMMKAEDMEALTKTEEGK